MSERRIKAKIKIMPPCPLEPPSFTTLYAMVDQRDAEIARLREKALAYDLDQAGIKQRNAEAVELVEARAEIARLQKKLREIRYTIKYHTNCNGDTVVQVEPEVDHETV